MFILLYAILGIAYAGDRRPSRIRPPILPCTYTNSRSPFLFTHMNSVLSAWHAQICEFLPFAFTSQIFPRTLGSSGEWEINSRLEFFCFDCLALRSEFMT